MQSPFLISPAARPAASLGSPLTIPTPTGPRPRPWHPPVAALVAAAALLLPAQGGEPDVALLRNASLAVNHPDEFAWRLFIEICQPAASGERVVIWETWPDQDHIYADPNQAPIWPATPPAAKRLRPPRQQAVRSAAFDVPPIPPDRIPDGDEEVRNNRPAFDYIVQQGLWYQEGVLQQAAKPGGIRFPQEAVTVKARWRYITPAEKPRFHWAEYELKGTNVLVGLTALHVTSKVIPNWHWATFEQVDNPGLGDFIGLVDTFGLIPPRLYPNPTPNQGYRGGRLNDAVLGLMREKRLGPEWTFYRLKGSQIDFTDSTGRATLLGNSITEAGFVATSSCMTCHARSSANLVQTSSGDQKWGTLSVFDPDGQSFNGPVNPDWFWFPIPNTDRVARQDLRFHQLDFLWQLGFEPKSRGN